MVYGFEKLTERDQRVIEISGYGAKRGFGKKPALVIIDTQNKFIGVDKPIFESMKEFPLSLGQNAVKAVKNIARILKVVREENIPVIYIKSETYPHERQFNSFSKKIHNYNKSQTQSTDVDLNAIVQEIEPDNRDIIIRKIYASGFFGTPLTSFLNTLGVDTLIVTGVITSGCVRAFVIDAASYNFNVGVVSDCVADRLEYAHDLSLTDMDLRYADIVNSDEVISYVLGIEN